MTFSAHLKAARFTLLLCSTCSMAQPDHLSSVRR